jgi:hypothetical protein
MEYAGKIEYQLSASVLWGRVIESVGTTEQGIISPRLAAQSDFMCCSRMVVLCFFLRLQ